MSATTAAVCYSAVIACGKWKQSRTRSSSLRMRELLRAAFTLAERFGLLSLILPPTQKVSAQGLKPKCDEAKSNHIGDPIPLDAIRASTPSRRLRRLSAAEYALSEDRRPRISQISKRRSRNTGHPNRRHAWPVVSEHIAKRRSRKRLSPQYRTRSPT